MRLLCLFFLFVYLEAVPGAQTRQLNLDEADAKKIDAKIEHILDDMVQVQDEVKRYLEEVDDNDDDVEEGDDAPPIDEKKIQHVDGGGHRSGLFWKKNAGLYPAKMMFRHDDKQKKSYDVAPPSSAIQSGLFFDSHAADELDDVREEDVKDLHHYKYHQKKSLKAAPPSSKHSGLFFDAAKAPPVAKHSGLFFDAVKKEKKRHIGCRDE